MLKNYFKIGVRHLLRHKAYMLINITGLGIALAMCIVAYLNWKFDSDFNLFHSKVDQLYRVTTIKSNTNQVYGVVPAPLKELAKNNITGVKDAIVTDVWGVSVNVKDQTFYESILFTEANILDWFDFPLLEGEARLDDPSSVLITERAAKKYFNNKEPIGKTITIFTEPSRQKDLTVSGIVETPPLNSSLIFDFIANNSNQVYSTGDQVKDEDWTQWRNAIFLAIENPEDQQNIEQQLMPYVAAHQSALPNFETKKFSLEPLRGMARRSDKWRRNGLREGIPISAVWGNILMAILLLLTASLNFANMTVSFAGKRLKEIGVRKVIGGNQGQLIAQLLVESFIICLLGLGAGLIFAEVVVDWYNQMWGFLELEISLLDNPPLLLFLAGTVVLTTLMAGAYPAFYISSFNPNRIFHGSVKFGGSNLVSRILLGLQIAISLIAVMTGLSFTRNANFQQTTDLGFEREGIQAVYTGNEKSFSVLSNEIKANPKVKGVAGVRFHIGDSCPRYEFELRGKKHEAEYMEVGEGYLELMDIKTLSGRTFNPALTTDFEEAIMVNEKFVKDFFPGEDPIGQTVTFFDTTQLKIIGVVGDFMQDSFFDPLRPLVVKISKPNRYLYLAIRTESKDMLDTRDALSNIWKTNFPTKPFEHNFQNDFLASALLVTNNIKTTMIMLAIVTMLLTITGLFALMSLNILKKLKEISIRRVLGASTGNIAYILNRSYFWIIIGGILVGCGLGAWLSMTLLDAIYPVNSGVSSMLFVVAGLIAVAVFVLTIAIKLVQVLRMNPADILKKE